jgi:DHA1 family multidrug resistance protein-like MFS transporter
VISPGQGSRNLTALTAASFIGFAGFTLVMPFLPLYIAQLGERDFGSIAAWTGISLGITPAITALLAPVWGRLADRVGRKFLVARSLFSFIVIMAAMAYVVHPWQLLALRIVQGLFAGYGALCLAMAADSAPSDRIARSIGMVQTAQRLGPALGPVLGGVVAGLVGLRNAFLVTACFYAVALAQLLVLYREPRLATHGTAARQARVTFRNVLAFENFVVLMAVIFGFQFVDRSLGPVLPLYVAALGVSPGRVALLSGLVFSILACGAAFGHHLGARMLRRRTARAMIGRAALIAAAAVALFAIVPGPWTLALAAAVFGVAVGSAMTSAYAAAAATMPAELRGTGFGLLTSASLVGIAVSPMISGFVAATDMRIVFLADAVILCIVALSVRHVMVDSPAPAAAPTVEEC